MSFQKAGDNLKVIVLPLILLTAFFYFMLQTARPSISAGDTPELAASAGVLGIAHSPGYPLFTITGKTAASALGLGNFAYRMNALSAIWALAAVFLTYLLIKNIGPVYGLIACLFLCGSKIFWKEAVISEVFSLNMLCAAAAAFLIFSGMGKNISEKRVNRIYLIFFLLGVFLGNHHTMLMILPMAGIYVFFMLKGFTLRNAVWVLAVASVFFALGLSLYIFLPLRSLREPLLDWEDPQVFERFWGVVARLRYGSLSLAQGEPRPINLISIGEQFVFYGRVLFGNYPLAGLAAGILGLFKLFSKNKPVFLLNIVFLFFTGPFMFIIANVPHTQHTEYLMERFFMVSLIPVVIFSAYGLLFVFEILQKINIKAAAAAFVLIIIFGTAAIKQRYYENINLRNSLQVYDTGKNTLKHLKQNSLLLADRADETEFALAYLKYQAKKREDVEFVDCNAGVTKSIYGPDYYKIWGAGRLSARNIVEERLIGSFKGCVYYATLLPEQTRTAKTPYGIVYLAKGKAVEGVSSAWDFVLLPPRGGNHGDAREIMHYSNYYKELGDYYLKVNLNEEAVKFYGYSLSAVGGWRKQGVNIAYEVYKTGRLNAARLIYEGVLQRQPDNQQAWNNLGVIYNEMSQLEEASRAFNTLISLNPNFAEAYYNLSIVEWKRKNFVTAAKLLEKALEVRPGYSEAAQFLNKLK